jgi:hypothetical protein
MALQLWGLIGILLFVGLIISLILWKIDYFLSLSLFKTAHSSASISLLAGYDLYHAPNAIKYEPDIPYLPIIIGVIICCLAIVSIYIKNFFNGYPNLPFRFRWLWLTCGLVFLWIGEFLTIAALYSPILFSHNQTPLPGLACYIWLPVVTIVSLIFFPISRMNADSSPNFMRCVVFLVACSCILSTFSISLIMRKAILVTKISYTFWGAIITLGLLPPSLVILGIAKDYLPLRPVDQSSSVPTINQEIEG